MRIRTGGTVRIAHGPPSNDVLGRPRASTVSAKSLSEAEIDPIAGVRDRRLWSDLIDVFSDNHCDQTSLKIAHNLLGGAHPPFRARQPG